MLVLSTASFGNGRTDGVPSRFYWMAPPPAVVADWAMVRSPICNMNA
jgi:hypothetical protein